MAYKGIMRLEGLDETQAEMDETTVDQTSGAADFVDGPEAPLAEVTEAGNEIDTIDADIDKAEVVVGKLEEMDEGLDAVVAEDGGLTEAGASVVEASLEGLRISVGFAPRATKMSFEGFKDKAKRVDMTHYVQEGIKDTLKAIWVGMVNAFQQTIAAIQRFFAAMFDTAERYAQRAQKLVTLAKSKVGLKAKGDAKVKQNTKVLNVDGDAVEGSAFVSAYDKSNDVMDVAKQTAYFSDSKDIVGKLSDLIGMVGQKEKYEPAFASMLELSVKHCEKTQGRKLVFGQVEISVEPVKNLLGKKVKIVFQSIEGAKEVANKEVSPLAVADALKVAVAATEHLAHYKRMKETNVMVKAMLDKLTASAKAAVASSAKSEDAEEGKRASQINQCVRLQVSAMTSFPSIERRHDLAIQGAALDYVAVSIKALEGEGAKEGSALALGNSAK